MLNKKLDGLQAELVDNERVETLSFNGGSISATLGVKNGAVTAPILEYKITGESSLEISGIFSIKWENIEFEENRINVARNGEHVVYKITKISTKKQQRRLP